MFLVTGNNFTHNKLLPLLSEGVQTYHEWCERENINCAEVKSTGG